MRARVLLTSENQEDDQKAIDLMEQTVREDPQYAAAWATLGRAYSIKAFYFAAPEERKQLSQNAQVAVDKALAIEPQLAEGHFVRGLILWTHANRFQHEQAVQSYKRAIELDPKLDEARHQLALVYLHIGLFDKAWAEIGKALEINPANTLARYRYGVIDLYRGKYDDAYEISKSTPLEKNPSLHESQAATILFRLGRIAEAETIADHYLAQYPGDPGGIVTSVKALILARRGRADEAEAAIKRAEELGKDFGHFHHTAYNIACAYVMLKKPDEAVSYLQMAADDGFPCYPLFEGDELLKDLNKNPRYIALLAQLKQRWERYNATL
jgi:tetratricopeptide (TPR) repeat protein